MTKTFSAKFSLIFIITGLMYGCSSAWRDYQFVPTKSTGWKIYSDGAILLGADGSVREKLKASSICGRVKIEVEEFKKLDVGFFGPPIIPIIPIVEKRKIYFSLKIDGAENLSNCPIITLDNMRYGAKAHDFSGNKTCAYEARMNDRNFLKMEFLKYNGCDIPPLNFARESRWGYKPFVIPKT